MSYKCEVRVYQYRRSQLTNDQRGDVRKPNLPPTHTFTVVGDSLEGCRKDAQTRAVRILGRFPPPSVTFAEGGTDPKTGARFDKSIIVTKRIPEE
jgi:hypothetical protein